MYAVVGCNACHQLWILQGTQETATCPRCGKRHQVRRLRTFVETDDEDHAREVRASILANRSGHGEAFADVPSFGDLDAETDAPVVDDDTYLAGSGLDAEAVERAGESSTTGSSSTSRKETVLAALAEIDRPTEAAVLDYASERGVPRDYTRAALEKLVQGGVVSESDGRYRLL